MAYVDLAFVKKVLRDDYLRYPSDLTDYDNFAQTEIHSRLRGKFTIPFDDTNNYASVPPLIKWVASYLIGYKLYDERTSFDSSETSKGQQWWDMAQHWLTGLVEGDYLLHLADGTAVEGSGSTTQPRSYPSGVRDKAPSTDNTPLFKRSQVGEW